MAAATLPHASPAKLAARPLTPAEAMLEDAKWQLELATRAVEKAKQQRKDARQACRLAEKQVEYERKVEKNIEKAIKREHTLAERKKDQEAFAVLWSVMTPEQRQAECNRHVSVDKKHNEQRREQSRHYTAYLAKKAAIPLEVFKQLVTPIKAFLVTQAEKVLKLMIAGEMQEANVEGLLLQHLLKGKSQYIDSMILYYAKAGVEEKDAVKLRTFINRLDY